MTKRPWIDVPFKRIRARVIARWIREAEIERVVCFTCGNAAAALRAEGLSVIEVGPRGSLAPRRWWTQAEIRKCWPDAFDATSGHLNFELLFLLAAEFKKLCGKLGRGPYEVPTGSGETVVALALAYPKTRFIAVYDDRSLATRFEDKAPLNPLVRRLASVCRRNTRSAHR